MFADYEYYVEEYSGSKIENYSEYNYLAKQADRYIERYTKVVDEDTKACECALAEYLQMANKQGNMTSENIPNYYSVSWATKDENTRMREINSILELYLGDRYSSVGIVTLIG